MGDAIDADGANGICFPYDVLLDVLRRLPGRALARSRLVCRAWRAIVDAHALLLPKVFPREFPGVFATYYGFWTDYDFFAPPASRSRRPPRPADAEAGDPRFGRAVFSYGETCIQQHCNGLLLLRDNYEFDKVHYMYVCNPATERFDRLPPPPRPWRHDGEGMFLAFDPAVSRHHQVFLLAQTRPPEKEHPWWLSAESFDLQGLYGEETQRQSSKVLQASVFSSRTGQWELRQFTPGRCSPGRLYDLATAPRGAAERTWWSAEYWRGSLYIHCHGGVLLVLRCSEDLYDAVQLPSDPDPEDEEWKHTWTLPQRCVLASYESGVRFVELKELQLHVWVLTESGGGELGWTLAHKADLGPHGHALDSAEVQPEMRWEVVGCWKRDLRGSLMHRELMKRSKARLLQHNNHVMSSNEAEDEVQEEDDYDESSEDSDSGQSWETEGDSTVGEDESVDVAVGLEEDGSECSWNSEENNFIDMDESVAANPAHGEDSDDGEGEELGSIGDSEHTDDLGWGCRIVGLHPHKDVILLHMRRVGVAYHLGTSRMQYLGYMFPEHPMERTRGIHGAFPYRPCFIDALTI